MVKHLSGVWIFSWKLSDCTVCKAVCTILRLHCGWSQIYGKPELVRVQNRDMLQDRVLGSERAVLLVETLHQTACHCG